MWGWGRMGGWGVRGCGHGGEWGGGCRGVGLRSNGHGGVMGWAGMRGEGVGDVGVVVGWGTGAAGWALWGGGMEWDAWGYGPWATHCAVGLWALGWRIRSYGAMGRPCPTADSTGTHSLYTTYHGYEVMFHVSTMLPFTPTNPQQVCGARAVRGGRAHLWGPKPTPCNPPTPSLPTAAPAEAAHRERHRHHRLPGARSAALLPPRHPLPLPARLHRRASAPTLHAPHVLQVGG